MCQGFLTSAGLSFLFFRHSQRALILGWKGGGVLTPKSKKPSQFTNFGVATGFFLVFGFFSVSLVFLR